MRLVASSGAEYPLDRAEITIGRSATNTIVVSDPRVSGHHAVIRRDGDAFILSDPGSTNGTFINGSRLTAPQRLQIGDTITLGGTSFTVAPDEDYIQTAPLHSANDTLPDSPPLPSSAQAGWRTGPAASAPSRYYMEVQPIYTPTKDRTGAILLELLPGLFLNLLGIGWMYAGQTGTGLAIMVFDLAFLCFQIGAALVTVGLSLLCTLPLQLMFVIVSTASLSSHMNRYPEQFR
jgi:hypothetical protein